MTVKIVGLDQGESDAILNYLYSVYEGNVDIQVRFKWTPGSSALWDNRSVISLECTFFNLLTVFKNYYA